MKAVCFYGEGVVEVTREGEGRRRERLGQISPLHPCTRSSASANPPPPIPPIKIIIVGMYVSDNDVQQGQLKALEGKEVLPIELSSQEKDNLLERALSTILLSLVDEVLKEVADEA
ncbi:Retrovirus-related Pol polyprotein from transposon TNT 1-94 [Senna tora]|uniref:Retrovirus-related Pol polyprotein from transposon TNT 1-94 n=1 Tax=Senna tora TaxID=362788 RepID=A0A835CEL7_9FABA|nr:Retrovirus-related Pol polyprotein from transposon TNT 1-94 [Senna tora]